MKTATVLFAAALISVTASVHADAGVYRDSAKVVHVEPLVSWREVPVKRRVCGPRGHRDRHDRHDRHDGYYTDDNGAGEDYLLPTVLGGVVGAVAGSQADDRGLRMVTTAAGSAGGALLGYGLVRTGDDHHQHHRRRQHHGRKRCRTVTEYQRQRQVDGYRVTYRYRGHEFTTRTETRPGRRIPVRVKLKPQL